MRQIIARHDADADTSPEAGPRGKRLIPLSRAGIIGAAAACAVLAAGGLAAASLTGGGSGGSARQADVKNVAVGGTGAGAGNAAAAMPQGAAGPRMAVMPKAATSSPAAARSGSPAARLFAPAGGVSATCTHPSFVTSDQYGMWNQSPYFVYNDMWGISGYSVSQTLSACSYSNWYVTATMNNDNGDGHVNVPELAQGLGQRAGHPSLQSVTSTFAETSPGTGIYEDAYDIWLNGIADSGSTEVMVWTENHGQVPSGNHVATVTLDGRSWAVWKDGSYIAFVAGSNFTSGTMNLLTFFQWIMSQGWIPGNSTLGQVDYGVELVSTNGVPATFSFSNFSVSAS